MRLVISGTRHCPGAEALLEKAYAISPWVSCDVHILHGASGDVDYAAVCLAAKHHWSCEAFGAEWKAYGKAAGPIRNRAMAFECDAVLALWDGKSRGTLSMMTEAVRAGKPVFVYPINLQTTR